MFQTKMQQSEIDSIVSYAKLSLWLSRACNTMLFSSIILLGLKWIGAISVSYLIIILLFFLVAISTLAILPWFDMKADVVLSELGLDEFGETQLIKEINFYKNKYEHQNRNVIDGWKSFVRHLSLEDRKIAYVYLAKLKQKVKIKDIDLIFRCDRMMRVVSKNL